MAQARAINPRLQPAFSGQQAQVISRVPHGRWPNHVVVTAKAVTLCEASEPGFSGTRELTLMPGDTVMFTMAHDVSFRSAGGYIDGAHVAYYAMRDDPFVQS